MEPDFGTITTQVLLLGYIVPFAFFGFGVLICDVMKLHRLEKRLHLWMIAVPVALFSIAMLISSTRIDTVVDNKIFVQYAHLTDFNQYIMFLGIVVFIGTLVPSSFDRIRDQLGRGGGA